MKTSEEMVNSIGREYKITNLDDIEFSPSPYAVLCSRIKEGYEEVANSMLICNEKVQESNNKATGKAGSVEFFKT